MAQIANQTEPPSTAGQAKEQAKQQVQQARGQARERLREQVDQRSTQAGERVSSTAQDVRSVADELRKQGKDQPAKLAEQAAERVERAGGYLKESDADRILRDVEDFGRQKPWAVALGGLALGFAASRFLKASSSRRYEQQRGDTGYTPSEPPAAPSPTPPATGTTPVPSRPPAPASV
jgi:hypothetical protein